PSLEISLGTSHTFFQPVCSYCRIQAEGEGLVNRVLAPPEGLLSPSYEKILKLTADAKFESGDVKATVAVLSFILSSAAKHSVDGESLASELQQLGLPKEQVAGMCRCYEEKQSPLQKHLWICSLRSKYEASQGPGSF
ncbi:PREDICTED: COMM domain-containing protein 4-like, partial [Cercocebus atys]|uniref:COMM domain-containing protein 4-like n=1 Tax=Cercocebus atys TaxID=9531 RepID=UPI0005F3C99F